MLKKFKVSWCGECKGSAKVFVVLMQELQQELCSTEILEVISDI
jgi:hypothetical protein